MVAMVNPNGVGSMVKVPNGLSDEIVGTLLHWGTNNNTLSGVVVLPNGEVRIVSAYNIKFFTS